jgi:hypothetical protein
MKKWVALLGQAIILFGCAGVTSRTELPKIELQHPVGYPRLIKIVPECERVNPDNYSSCVVASRMLESATTQISTHWFLVHWEKVAFGDSASPVALEATRRIIIPVLKLLYQTSHDEYSKAMFFQTDKIQLTARGSFDSFMKTHQCLISPEKRPECSKR